MGLGELVAIMAGDPARVRIDQRQHRQLDDGGAIDQPVEDSELEWMDDILGIMQHHRLGRAPGRQLLGDQRIVEMIETMGLSRGPVGLDLDRMNARVDSLAIAAAVAGSLR